MALLSSYSSVLGAVGQREEAEVVLLSFRRIAQGLFDLHVALHHYLQSSRIRTC